MIPQRRYRAGLQTEAGFTLLEMLVGLVLFSLTATLLTASLRAGRTALNAISRTSATIPVATSQGYLRQAVAQARPLPRNAALGSSTQNFSGTPQSMAFTTAFAPQGQFEGLYRVEIGVAAREQRAVSDLNLAQVIWRPPADGSNPPALVRRATQLIGNVASVNFAFYGDMDDNAGASWHDSWLHPVKMPSLVALDVTFAANDPRRWDRLIMPIYAADSAAINCPPRGRCR
jgi:general secretion pathway protein J